LQQICSEHSGASKSNAMKIFDETLFVLFGFIIVKNLKVRYSVWFNNQELVQAMPLNTQRLMLECFVKVSLKVDQKSIKARKSQETTCG
jgi:hypothetical protein